MFTRVLTYDLRNGSPYDYRDLYNYFEEVKATQLTESSYLIKTDLSLEEFKQKIKNLTKYGDNVKVITSMKEDGLKVYDIR